MSRAAVRVFGGVLVAVFLTVGLVSAQDKPTQDKEKKEAVLVAADISGTWDGTVETPDGTISFGLTLKLEKDKVSGEIASDQGGAPVTGAFADGRLSLTFDYNGTPVTMTGALKDEALSGDMAFGSGEMVMGWTAKRRK